MQEKKTVATQHTWIKCSFWSVLSLSLFFIYPLILLLPQGLPAQNQLFIGLFSSHDLVFNGFAFKLEFLPLISCLAIAYLLSFQWRFKPGAFRLLLPAGLFLLFAAISTVLHKSSPFQFASTAAYVIIPIVVALIPPFNTENKTKKFFGWLFGSFWLINIIHALCFMIHYKSTSLAIPGLMGNKNWFIATLLACTPWAIRFFRPFFFRFFKPLKGSSRLGSAYVCSFIFTWSVTILALIQNKSRAAYLALAILIIWSIYCAASRKIKKILVLAFASILVFGMYYLSTHYQQVTHNELRPELWKSTAHMIQHAPTFGTAGPGQFEAIFPSYRNQQQLMLPIAASHTVHPHNQILLFAAESGLPATLALIIFFIYLWKVRDSHQNQAAQSLLLILVCASFDRALDQQALALILLINAGLLLSPYLRSRMSKAPDSQIIKLNRLFSLLLICGSLFITYRSAKASWFYRKGAIAESRTLNSSDEHLKREYRKQSYDLFVKAVDYQPANILYNYHAADSGLKAKIDTQQVGPFIDLVLRRAPDFIHINRFKAYYFEMIARLQTNKEQRALSLKRARLANQREEQLYAPQLDTLNDCQLFYLRNQLFHDAINLHQNFTSQSNRLAEHLHQDKLTPLMQDWRQKVLQNEPNDAIKIANNIRSGIKGLNYIDTPFSAAAPNKFKKARIIKGKQFNSADYLYWRDLFLVRDFLGKTTPGQATVDKILADIKLIPGRHFIPLNEVLVSKQATAQSLAVLLTLSANMQSKRAIILQETKSFSNWLCLMESPTGFLLISPNKKSSQSLTLQSWKQLQSTIKMKAFCFAYPQAFFSANSFLLSLYNSHFAEQSISALNPSLNWHLSNSVFATNKQLHFFQAIFNSTQAQVKKIHIP